MISMNDDDFSRFKVWFSEYVAGFYRDLQPDFNFAIRLKEEHTRRVCLNIRMMGKALGLGPRDMLLAETMALFHDVGRFRQYEKYETFKDASSENHALLGLREISCRGALSRLDAAEKRIVARAIAHHNVLSLPENEDEKSLFFMHLLRDADKLDIWKVMIDSYEDDRSTPGSVVVLGLPDDDTVSTNIINALKLGKIAAMDDMKSLNDFKLLQIGWVFDLNFAPAFRELRKQRYVERIAALLPASNEIHAAVDQAVEHVKDMALRGS
jgi:hypothetical protein